ncbi:hypothetical protein LRP88_01964 [Fusarium phalaenopsidis]|nr:hypothetical protein NCS56_01355200 [Fusarium sp. Ph1]
MNSCLRCSGLSSVFKFFCVFVLVTLILVLTGQYESVLEPPRVPQPTISAVSDQENAYVFYATDNTYACSVLVNVHILRKTHETKRRIIVLVSKDVSSKYHSSFKSLSAEVIQRKPMGLHPEANKDYKNSLLKLEAFRLPEIDPSLKRLLVVEGDQLVLKDLDHLFDLPPADIYAPRAYWARDELFSSTLMLIQPTPEMWNDIKEMIPNLQPNQLEMDVINDIFSGKAAPIPESYVVLNSHWSEWTLPPWFTPSASVTTSEAAGVTPTPSAKPSNEELDELSLQAHIVHFSAEIGKPWDYDVWQVGELEFNAHQVLLLQWQEWRVRALALCPAGVIDHV